MSNLLDILLLVASLLLVAMPFVPSSLVAVWSCLVCFDVLTREPGSTDPRKTLLPPSLATPLSGRVMALRGNHWIRHW